MTIYLLIETYDQKKAKDTVHNIKIHLKHPLGNITRRLKHLDGYPETDQNIYATFGFFFHSFVFVSFQELQFCV